MDQDSIDTVIAGSRMIGISTELMQIRNPAKVRSVKMM